MDTTKKRIEALMDYVNEKGYTMTIADIANVSETIDGIRLRLEDIPEDDFPNKEDVISILANLRSDLRETPYYEIPSTIFGELQVIISYYFK